MKKLLVILFPMLLYTSSTFGCINGIGFEEIAGMYHYRPLSWVRDVKLSDYGKQIQKWKTQLLEMSSGSVTMEQEARIDLAIMAIFEGKYEEALDLLHHADRSRHLYRIYSNLGVVHELRGNPDSAEYYVKKAVELEPWSHNGSEWIHLRLLQFVNGKYRSGHILPYKVLSVQGLGGKTELLVGSVRTTVDRLLKQIDFQLHERMLFVKPQNKEVADLLYTMGMLHRLKYDFEGSKQYFVLAAEYDHALAEECRVYAEADYSGLDRLEKLFLHSYSAQRRADSLVYHTSAVLADKNRVSAYARIEKDYAEAVYARKQRKIYGIYGGAIVLAATGAWYLRRRKRRAR